MIYTVNILSRMESLPETQEPECCICYNSEKKWFHAKCGHQWCRKCHRQMQRYDLKKCPLCRATFRVVLPNIEIKAMKAEAYDERLIRWRVKRHRKKERRASYILL